VIFRRLFAANPTLGAVRREKKEEERSFRNRTAVEKKKNDRPRKNAFLGKKIKGRSVLGGTFCTGPLESSRGKGGKKKG